MKFFIHNFTRKTPVNVAMCDVPCCADDIILTCARKLAVKPAYSTTRPKIKRKNN